LYTRRAEVLDDMGRYADAARDFREGRRLCTNPAHGDYCAARAFVSLVRAGERAEAQAHAAGLDPDKVAHPFPCAELARGWSLLAKAAGEDPGEREKVVAAALRGARSALAAAQRKGMFADPSTVCRYRSDPDFEPVWDAIPDGAR